MVSRKAMLHVVEFIMTFQPEIENAIEATSPAYQEFCELLAGDPQYPELTEEQVIAAFKMACFSKKYQLYRDWCNKQKFLIVSKKNFSFQAIEILGLKHIEPELFYDPSFFAGEKVWFYLADISRRWEDKIKSGEALAIFEKTKPNMKPGATFDEFQVIALGMNYSSSKTTLVSCYDDLAYQASVLGFAFCSRHYFVKLVNIIICEAQEALLQALDRKETKGGSDAPKH